MTERVAEGSGIDALGVAERVDEAVQAVDQEHMGSAEQRLETQTDVLMRPARVELAPDVLDRKVRSCDVLRLENRLEPPFGKSAGEQLALLMQRDFIAAPSRRGDRGQDAGHRQRDPECYREDCARTEGPFGVLHFAESIPQHSPHGTSSGARMPTLYVRVPGRGLLCQELAG